MNWEPNGASECKCSTYYYKTGDYFPFNTLDSSSYDYKPGDVPGFWRFGS